MLKNSIIQKAMLVVLMLFWGFSSTMAADLIRLHVKEDRASCTGVTLQSCLQVKYKDSKEWELFYGDIQGFKYQEGYRYTIAVIRTKRKNVPADASAYIYKLQRILKKVKVAVVPSTVNALPVPVNQKWVLSRMNGHAVSSNAISLTLDITMLRFSGTGGCNNIFGNFSYDKETKVITFSEVSSTLMACVDDEANKLENEYTKTLNQRTFTLVVGNNSLFLSRGNERVLEFYKEGIKDKPTANTGDAAWKFIAKHKWKLIQLNNVHYLTPEVTLFFNLEEKRFSGFSGCNNYMGTYETNGDVINFGPVASTRRACQDESASKLEKAFLNQMGKKIRYNLADQTLNFYENNRLVLMFGVVF